MAPPKSGVAYYAANHSRSGRSDSGSVRGDGARVVHNSGASLSSADYYGGGNGPVSFEIPAAVSNSELRRPSSRISTTTVKTETGIPVNSPYEVELTRPPSRIFRRLNEETSRPMEKVPRGIPWLRVQSFVVYSKILNFLNYLASLISNQRKRRHRQQTWLYPIPGLVSFVDRSSRNPGNSQVTNQRLARLQKHLRESRYEEEPRPSSLFIFSYENLFCSVSRWVVESAWFEYLILAVIIANCVVMAMEVNLPAKDSSALSADLEESELVFLVIFCIEFVLKVLAMGFILHRRSYMRSIWNILDFIVVVSGVALQFVTDADVGLQTLRAIRVLRPLKLVAGIPSLQTVMSSIVLSMVRLLQISVLILFVMLIFAIVGLEFYKGAFHYACFQVIKGNLTRAIHIDRPCYPDPDPPMGAFVCPSNVSRCSLYSDGPNHGITSFDNIGNSLLTVFQIFTMEGWTDILYWTNDAFGSYFNWVFFFLIVIIGSFFMLNLVLGVLSGQFGIEREKTASRALVKKLRTRAAMRMELDNLDEWLIKGEDVMLVEGGIQPKPRKHKKIALTDAEQETEEKKEAAAAAEAAAVPLDTIFSKLKEGGGERSKKFLCINFKVIRRIRRRIRRKCKTNAWFWTIIALVFLNTVCAAVEYAGQPAWLDDFLLGAEIFFLVFFTLEMIVKVFGFGRKFFRSYFNVFDLIVIIASIVDMVLSLAYGEPLGLSVLRAFRLLRIFKVTQYWRPLNNLVVSLIGSIKAIVSLLFLLFICMLIFALLGMQIFGGKMVFEDHIPRANFDDFGTAMMTVFQILTGEDWNEIMYEGIEALAGGERPSWQNAGMWGSLYFIVLVLVGNYTLLNVFLAIAVDNITNAQELTEDQDYQAAFGKEEEEDEDDEDTDDESETKKKNEDGTSVDSGIANDAFEPDEPVGDPGDIELETVSRDVDNPYANVSAMASVVSVDGGGEVNVDVVNIETKFGAPEIAAAAAATSAATAAVAAPAEKPGGLKGLGAAFKNFRGAKSSSAAANPASAAAVPSPKPVHNADHTDHADLADVAAAAADAHAEVEAVYEDIEAGEALEDEEDFWNFEMQKKRNEVPMVRHTAFYVFTKDNWFRRKVHFVVHYPYFDKFIMFIILASSIALAAEDPIDPASTRNQVLFKLDYVFTAAFILEFLLKVIDEGFVMHRGSYCRNWWNILDMIVVLGAVLSYILSEFGGQDGVKVIKILRVLRVLRPLKSINRLPGLRAVFDCVVNSVRNVFSILLVYLLFQLIFAIIGVEIFSRRFFFCNDPSKETQEECQGFFVTPENGVNVMRPREWLRHDFHFDNVLNAMLTLFAVSTGEGWPGIYHNSEDATYPFRGPSYNYRPSVAIYYVLYFIIFPFFFINVFVALIIITFQEKGLDGEEAEIDRNQKACIEFAIMARPLKIYIPVNKKTLHYMLWQLVTSSVFEYFIMTMIVLNTLVLMMDVYDPPRDYVVVLKYLNIFFTAIFLLEALLKVGGFGPIRYITDAWNIFDLITVFGSIADILVTELDSSFISLGFLRLFRAARLIKLLRQGSNIRVLLWTFVQSFRSLPYVLLLIFFLFFAYAIIGMQIFGSIDVSGSANPINNHNNFSTFFYAFLLLFRCATGEAWQSIMMAVISAPCSPDYIAYELRSAATTNSTIAPSTISCGSAFSYVYFTTFVFLAMFLFLNLFVAVIMDNFDYLTRDGSILGSHHLDEFVKAWAEFDPNGEGRIHHSKLFDLLKNLAPPLGFGSHCTREVAFRRLVRMNMPLDESMTVHFNTTLFALVRQSLHIKMEPRHPTGTFRDREKATSELRMYIRRAWPYHSRKMMNLVLPRKDAYAGDRMTMGKVYIGRIILESWRAFVEERRTWAWQPEVDEVEMEMEMDMSDESDEYDEVDYDAVNVFQAQIHNQEKKVA